jgi:LPXTG-motif cell wall-anchored protein
VLDTLLQQLKSQAGWSGLVLTLIQWHCQLAENRLKAFKQQVFFAICLLIAGWTLFFLGLAAFAIAVVIAYWNENPLYILAGLGFSNAALGLTLLVLSKRRMNQL